MREQNIIFFDGVCGLCSRMVDFVVRQDQERFFLYSPLEGETFRSIKRDHLETLNPDSIFVLRRGPGKEVLLQKSDALIYIADNLPKYRWLATIGRVLPKLIRDAAYQAIAATRYRIWGKRDSCRIPNAEESSRFLP
jgi:predicted DCC family thiol-disulfide oxidoreductase YuxK